jgi:hypothetical protein
VDQPAQTRAAHTERLTHECLKLLDRFRQRSSRRIEAACRTDAAYRVICGDVVPDHATIARFLVNHEHAIEDVFVAVLRLCAAAGLVSVGMVAIDGTKIGSDAALDRNRSAEWIRREVATILSRARETDACENDQPGLLAVDQLPEQLSSATGRLARLEEALALIEAQDAAAAAKAQARAANARDEAAAGRKLRGRKPKDPHAALARAEADETAVRVKARRQTAGHASDAELAEALEADPNVQAAAQATATARVAAQAATPTTRANITDPQSRIMKTADGWVQGYNVQAACGDGTPAAHRARCGRLRETVPPRRARLRYQGQPQLPTVPPPRPRGSPKRMGAHGHRAQPRPAPPTQLTAAPSLVRPTTTTPLAPKRRARAPRAGRTPTPLSAHPTTTVTAPRPQPRRTSRSCVHPHRSTRQASRTQLRVIAAFCDSLLYVFFYEQRKQVEARQIASSKSVGLTN